MATVSKKVPAESYSTAEVAQRLGVSIPTVQRWVDLGYLKAWKTLGGHRRIDAQSAERFFAGQGVPESAGTQAHTGASSPGLLALVVDDNPDDRDVLCALLEAALPRAKILQAEDGFQALIIVGQQAPDLVVTDVMMPNMNGFEMIRHLSVTTAVRPRLIIAVSAHTPKQMAKLGTLPQGVRFFPKPVDPPQFLACLRAATSGGILTAQGRA